MKPLLVSFIDWRIHRHQKRASRLAHGYRRRLTGWSWP